jgi:hypothetical protein
MSVCALAHAQLHVHVRYMSVCALAHAQLHVHVHVRYMSVCALAHAQLHVRYMSVCALAHALCALAHAQLHVRYMSGSDCALRHKRLHASTPTHLDPHYELAAGTHHYLWAVGVTGRLQRDTAKAPIIQCRARVHVDDLTNRTNAGPSERAQEGVVSCVHGVSVSTSPALGCPGRLRGCGIAGDLLTAHGTSRPAEARTRASIQTCSLRWMD